MSTYSNRLQPALRNLLQHVVWFFHPRLSCTMPYIGGRSENSIKFVMHDDLGWKNQTTQYILPRHWLNKWFSGFPSCGTYLVLSRSPSVDELLSQSEFDLFVKTSLPGHCLHHLLPIYRSSNLRERGHSFHLPDYDTVLFKKSFIVRSLYKFVASNY